ncbi:hypothetical protein [Roseibium sp. Sym1]|uniref:hypothetical protein n=1 Tax=Roseibium sp. Sym1 TaxID=3016006 RepID=UPI0022B34AFF|nr:hypothetical protein [Roseibium sp. Sym1]
MKVTKTSKRGVTVKAPSTSEALAGDVRSAMKKLGANIIVHEPLALPEAESVPEDEILPSDKKKPR